MADAGARTTFPLTPALEIQQRRFRLLVTTALLSVLYCPSSSITGSPFRTETAAGPAASIIIGNVEIRVLIVISPSPPGMSASSLGLLRGSCSVLTRAVISQARLLPSKGSEQSAAAAAVRECLISPSVDPPPCFCPFGAIWSPRIAHLSEGTETPSGHAHRPPSQRPPSVPSHDASSARDHLLLEIPKASSFLFSFLTSESPSCIETYTTESTGVPTRMHPRLPTRSIFCLVLAVLSTLVTASRIIQFHNPSHVSHLLPSIEEATVEKLQNLQHDGVVTSVDLVLTFLERIKEVNGVFRAVSEINPDALDIAHALDEERRAGCVRGPLHGVPILVKDNIATRDLMNNTSGSFALLGAKVAREATAVEKLRRAGAVILGKATTGVWAQYRSSIVSSSHGWSPYGGQPIGPYYPDQDPSGSCK